MPRRARVHFVSLRSSLVNLPISIYGPLLERNVRPQNLAIHLTVVAPPRSTNDPVEACVGWTGLASASSLVHFDSSKPGDKGLETIEIDPQYAQGLGFTQGDMVEIGLLYDLPLAKSVTTEPLTSDDWEIIEIHSSHVESTLLSQVRVARIGQELDVWVMGRTRVCLRVTHLDPESPDKTLLLTTNTEVSIAPKPYRVQQPAAASDSVLKGKTSLGAKPVGGMGNEKSVRLTREAQVLRVLPTRISPTQLPDHEGLEHVAYVSPFTFTELHLSSKLEYGICLKAAFKRLVPPLEPSAQTSSPGETRAPMSPIFKPSADDHSVELEDGAKNYIYIGPLDNLPQGHIVFPAAPDTIEDWDVVVICPVADPYSVKVVMQVTNDDLATSSLSSSQPSLAGVEDVLERCTNFCTRLFFMHSWTGIVQGVTSLLVTGRTGAGKTSIVQSVAKAVQEDPRILAYTYFVDVSRYSDKPVSAVRDLFQYWFDKMAWHRPSILILDNLDSLLSAELEHTDSFRSRHLAELFLSIYSSSARTALLNTRGIVLVATATSTASLHPLMSSSHIFKDITNVKSPDKNARRAILASLVRDRLAVAQDIQEDTQSPINFTAVATQTEGYSVTDLKDLVGRAIHQVAVRVSTKNVPPLLSALDFVTAQVDFVPLSLRDVKLQKSEVAWSDIGGLHQTRKVLRETLEWPTKYGPIFAQSPLRLRSGLLLYGFPGCGKTLLASAVAKECGLNFISVKGPEILNKYIGASEKSVRDLFERASTAKPCVLFFDEFDSIAPKRGHDSTGVTDRVVNQMLTQMDGAEGLDGVYVLAATSRPDLIDPALLRPGRLDKSLFCGMPDHEERKDILRAVGRKVSLSPSVDLKDVANLTDGYSGADLQALLYNAHLEVIHGSIMAFPGGAQSRDDEEPIEFCSFGGPPGNNKVASKAEEMLLQQRLRRIRAASRSEEAVVKSESTKPNKVDITMDDIRQALKSTRPSVSLEERARLDRIYRNFLSDRDGVLPTPPDASTVGSRISLG